MTMKQTRTTTRAAQMPQTLAMSAQIIPTDAEARTVCYSSRLDHPANQDYEAGLEEYATNQQAFRP